MNKKNIIIISAAVLALILIFSFAYFGLKNYQAKKLKPAEKQEQKAGQAQTKATTTPEFKAITIEQKQAEAKKEEAKFSQIIATSLNLADCDALDANYKSGCVFNVIINQAKSKLDGSLCSSITEKYYRDNCQVQVEQVKEIKVQAEKAEAAKIKDERFKKNTAYQEVLKYQDGKTVIPDEAMAAYMQLVFSYEDPAYCQYLPVYKIQECNDLEAMHQAEIKEDIAGCQNVKIDYWKNKCIAAVTIKKAHHDLNPALCQSLSGANKTECLSGL